MAIYYTLDDRQPKAAALEVASRLAHRIAPAGAIKSIEHATALVLGDAVPRVVDFHRRLSIAPTHDHTNPAACRRVAYGVLHQVVQHYSQTLGLAGYDSGLKVQL
jgi:hypothetical protein